MPTGIVLMPLPEFIYFPRICMKSYFLSHLPVILVPPCHVSGLHPFFSHRSYNVSPCLFCRLIRYSCTPILDTLVSSFLNRNQEFLIVKLHLRVQTHLQLDGVGVDFGTSVRRSSGRRSGVAVRAVDCWQ